MLFPNLVSISANSFSNEIPAMAKGYAAPANDRRLDRFVKPKSARHKWGRRDADPSLDSLLRQLIAARKRCGMTQDEVAYRLRTTKSAISRLECGLRSRPTLTTIENYALVVGYSVQITLRPSAGHPMRYWWTNDSGG